MSLIDYLTLGFVPDYERASEYLSDLLAPTSSFVGGDFTNLLASIIESTTYAHGFREVMIPLTGGFDSRAILGACLTIYPAARVHCCTIGPEGSPDSIVARQTCQRLGVAHHRLSPKQFDWDVDRLTELASDGSGLTPPIDGLFAFSQLAQEVSKGVPVLSGYLGDAISGAHLSPLEHEREEPEGAAARFVDKNRAITCDGRRLNSISRHQERLRTELAEFGVDQQEKIVDREGGTLFDLLDIGLRQSHRIRAVASAFEFCIYPYEDPRWVSYWLSRPLKERLNQKAYKRGLRRFQPTIFTSSPAHLNRLRWRLPMRLRRAVRRVIPARREHHFERGDPRTNQSLAETLKEGARSFDARKITPFSASQAVDSVVAEPTDRSLKVAYWILSAEVHIRAGNLAE